MHRHHGHIPPVQGPTPSALRTFDAYRRADRLGLEVAFEDLETEATSLLLRNDGVILIEKSLCEIERHDELTHQLQHLEASARRDESLADLETRVRRGTAHRLIPFDPLLDAVSLVLESEKTPRATSVATVLGVQTVTLQDRFRSFTPTELADGIEEVINLLVWPSIVAVKTTCLQDSSGPASWLRRILPPWH
ncbi:MULTISPECIES: hypothetical protein [unclassified Nocardia]|uniref:hypothetical protein n=1 Tax=unclassified Nocardia TaxID=2637762 RepID=UPI00278C07C7|nr:MULTISPECIES: hypothetical protein [unclassified Nocardia]